MNVDGAVKRPEWLAQGLLGQVVLGHGFWGVLDQQGQQIEFSAR